MVGAYRVSPVGDTILSEEERPMADLARVVHSDPEILGGTPVFVGTRVPLQNLIDWLESGETIDEFLDQFPSVKREQVIGFLRQGAELLIAAAHEGTARPT